MRNFIVAVAALLACAWAAPAGAASIFWSTAAKTGGGGGTSCGDGTYAWDADSGTGGAAHKCWATATNGTTAAAIPGPSDIAIFDANSGSGTVNVVTPNNPSGAAEVNIGGYTLGAYVGGLNFGTNNVTLTLTGTNLASNNGAGTRTINLGTGTWTISSNAATGSAVWNWGTLTGCTCTASGATLNFTNIGTAGNTLTLGAPTGGTGGYGTITLAGKGGYSLATATIATLHLTAPTALNEAATGTLTVTNNFAFAGSIGNWIYLIGGGTAPSTAGIVSVGAGSGTSTCAYCIIRSMTFSGAGVTFTGTNTIDAGGNTGMTITAPSTNPHIIGGS